MFETTLEAQSLHAGDRRLATLSAAALAHLGIGLAIVAVTAVVVPPVHVPEPPRGLIVIAPVDPFLGEATALHRPPPPKKGTGSSNAGKQLVVPPADPVMQPAATPETLADASPVHETGDDHPGTAGAPDGDDRGISGGLGDGPGPGSGGYASSAGPLPLSGDMECPVLLSKTEPSYPNLARIARLPGKVVVEAVIGLDGRVESAAVVSSTSALFDAAAVDAVRQWRYKPALMNGRPVRVYFKVAVTFVIR